MLILSVVSSTQKCRNTEVKNIWLDLHMFFWALVKKPSSYCVLWCQNQDIDGDEPVKTHLKDMDNFLGIKK